MNIREDRIVARGRWLYDGTVPCRVVVTRESFWPGSGDDEDPPEIADDREVECFQVRYESPATAGMFAAGGGYFASIAEAMQSVERAVTGDVAWEG